MHPNLFISPILIIVYIATFNFLGTLCADNFRFSNCGQKISCGGIDDLTYPFWGVNRPAYCGLPEFELQCEDNVPKIRMVEEKYRVLDINTTRRSLTVVRDDYWETVCPQVLKNTSIDFSSFNYVGGLRNLSLFYNCSGRGLSSVPWQRTPISCSETNINVYPAIEDSEIEQYIGLCSSRVIITLFNSSAEAMLSGNKEVMAAVDDGYGTQWNVTTSSQCDACRKSGGLCGHNTTSSQFACFCSDQPSDTTVCSGSSDKRSWSTILLAIAEISVMGVVCLILPVSCILIPHILLKFKDREADRIEDFIRDHGSLTPKRYSYEEVKRLTKSFAEELGKGGYGTVYKGKFPDGKLLAVKILSESKGNGDEFINEVASISRTSHVNVVTLVGFCYNRTKRALIYEFMPNGSLDKYIGDSFSNKMNSLDWEILYQITVGIARGLEYLHRGCNTSILHFDIKPQNILLDDKFCPKISDFGLAKLCKREQSILSTIEPRGTVGYIAPEVFLRTFGRVSHKSDVYSYGMMVLEMVGGRKNPNVGLSENSEMYFPGWLYKLLEPGDVIELDGVESEEEKKLARKMILVGMWCIQTNPVNRPSMSNVVEMLEATVESLQIPPKPSLSSPSTAAQPFSVASSGSSSDQTS